jgi:hypothetical protein
VHDAKAQPQAAANEPEEERAGWIGRARWSATQPRTVYYRERNGRELVDEFFEGPAGQADPKIDFYDELGAETFQRSRTTPGSP